MKRIVVSMDWPRIRLRSRRFLATGRAYLTLSLCSMVLFVLLGLGGMLQNKLAASPMQSMKGFAASVSGSFFSSLLGMELPHMDKPEEKSPFATERMASFLLRFLTDVNPDDPKSLLAMEMPGANGNEAVLFRPGSGGDANAAPEDHGPPASGDPGEDPAPSPDGGGGETADPSPPASQTQEPDPGDAAPPAGKTTEGRKVVFIYHSHNRESWFPELKPGTKDPNSGKINVTLVGKRLADQLEKRGVGAAHSNQDYATSIKDYDWNKSYKYSKETVAQAMASNGDLQFFFDIHRDSKRRKDSTATIGGTDYAKVFFIIGERNPRWKENEAFANSIHEKLEAAYPGLSSGIWGKTAANGNGEYNQSVSPDSVLIEIGGVDNTLAECYRTADVLAKTISEIYWAQQQAVEAGGSAPAGKTAS
ncbi:stage II sporulation protein P [Cohnella nanjingensis]|uniref:Stage II sporulation protein P n=1 Tax=Cohnella nanjingensis TaxID=1387779 RepID=A0A7X0RUJ7_9BACL|nr:stage II sporulation protein P [Cohnella nanjingensis]MBB6673967.1 stage II sporulation protein P [Cohnella nanjingensis]